MSVTREYESADLFDEFAEIERAVMETARGRWFLSEHAKRERVADTALILAAIRRLEAAIAPRLQPAAAVPAPAPPENMRYFRQDEDIFEPVPGLKPERPALRVIAAAQCAPAPEVPPEKAVSRVTFKRIAPEAPAATGESQPEPVAATASQPEATTPALETIEAAKPRIVVLRRPPSELLAIPLADTNTENAVA